MTLRAKPPDAKGGGIISPSRSLPSHSERYFSPGQHYGSRQRLHSAYSDISSCRPFCPFLCDRHSPVSDSDTRSRKFSLTFPRRTPRPLHGIKWGSPSALLPFFPLPAPLNTFAYLRSDCFSVDASSASFTFCRLSLFPSLPTKKPWNLS